MEAAMAEYQNMLANVPPAQREMMKKMMGKRMPQGMGEGTLKDSVPEAHTDYFIAIISEEYGSIISICIIIIFLYIVTR